VGQVPDVPKKQELSVLVNVKRREFAALWKNNKNSIDIAVFLIAFCKEMAIVLQSFGAEVTTIG
jgi:hypothetical protein